PRELSRRDHWPSRYLQTTGIPSMRTCRARCPGRTGKDTLRRGTPLDRHFALKGVPPAVHCQPMIVHLLDGTYELFRHFHGLRRFTKGRDRPYGAVVGVLQSVLQLIEQGETLVGVATDHVIESFRNELWPGYKTGEGIEPALLEQFPQLEEALGAMGVVTWPMVELEADDA